MKMKRLIQISVGVFVALSIPTFFALAVTADDCQGAWDQSSASSTCNVQNIDTALSLDCHVSAECRQTTPSGAQWVNTNIDGSLDDFKKLHNCQGTLQVGACT